MKITVKGTIWPLKVQLWIHPWGLMKFQWSKAATDLARGGVRNFPAGGTESYDEETKVRLAGYYNC